MKDLALLHKLHVCVSKQLYMVFSCIYTSIYHIISSSGVSKVKSRDMIISSGSLEQN